MSTHGRIQHSDLRRKMVPAEAAAAPIPAGGTVGMSGFTGSGCPKEVPLALARRITEADAAGAGFRIDVWTGASTAPELDGALAAVDGIELRLPYQSDPVSREKINPGTMDYIDVHLSHVAQMVWEGFLGHLDVALVEVSGIHRGDPGRHALPAQVRPDDGRVGHGLLEPGGGRAPRRGGARLPRPDRAAAPGDQQPPGADPPARGAGHERGHRGRHLRQRQLHAPHGQPDPERHRWVRRLRPHAYVSFFVTPSTAKGGAISSIVPTVSHVDHTEHDVHVVGTEQGLADLRGLAPRKRAWVIIDNCAHPDYRPLLDDYLERAQRGAYGRHTPHLLGEALGWHQRFVHTGTMALPN